MIPPLALLADAAVAVLDDALRPMHYRQLTLAALDQLGWEAEAEVVRRSAEDLREKVAEAGRLGLFYTGRPACLVAPRWWFCRDQFLLNVGQPLLIPVSLEAALDACTELLMRKDYLITSTDRGSYVRWRAAARGQLIEKHISLWFKQRWPSLWLPAANAGLWDRWCDHDFKLHLGGKLYTVDVLGPRWDDFYGFPRHKDKPVTASVFLTGRWDEPSEILLEGCLAQGDREKEEFRAGFVADQLSPIQPLLVRCNCEVNAIDWQQLRALASRGARIPARL